MAKRVSKQVALELIPYVKKIDCVANFRNPTSKSCVEFAKQMMSSKLKKKNPILEVDMLFHDEENPAFIVAEFTDGKPWRIDTSAMTAAAIRAEFFDRAELAEEHSEEQEMEPNVDEPFPTATTAAKTKANAAAAAKPAAKPAAKK